jgi:hypothetical protein
MEKNPGRTKEATSFRLSPTAKQLLVRMAQEMGISQADVIEVSIRSLARREGITVSEERRSAALAPPAMSPEERAARVRAAVGSMKHVRGSVEEFLREKHEESEREEARLERHRKAGAS